MAGESMPRSNLRLVAAVALTILGLTLIADYLNGFGLVLVADLVGIGLFATVLLAAKKARHFTWLCHLLLAGGLGVISATYLLKLDQGVENLDLLYTPLIVVAAAFIVSVRSLFAWTVVTIVATAALLVFTAGAATETEPGLADQILAYGFVMVGFLAFGAVTRDNAHRYVTDARVQRDRANALAAELEQRVQARTAELADANTRLRVEMDQRLGYEKVLAHQAAHDPLTGLPNRTKLNTWLGEALARCSPESPLGLIFLDLDMFKQANDTMGHQAGDCVLVAVAERLRRLESDHTLVARFGGDEFVLVREDTDAAALLEISDRIAELLRDPFFVQESAVYQSASGGAVLAVSPATNPTHLLRDADIAMYRAKDKGRGRTELFVQEMGDDIADRVRRERALRQGVSRDEFVVHYQPIVDIRDGTTIGAEALLRWVRGGEVVPAGEFIDIVEETGLILELGSWVLREVCGQHAALEAQVRSPLRVHVNVSPLQAQQPDFVAEVLQALDDASVPRRSLGIEITEGTLVDASSDVYSKLATLRDAGIQVILDDFCTRYSSLAYLKQLPVDAIKVDRSFVDGIGIDPVDDAIVRAILDLASSLGIGVVAEGVETFEQARTLSDLGCPMAQGWLYGKALPVSAWPGATTAHTRTGRAP
ncbi:MAG: EAL domain-containing protein [Acidimicrobiia bacterium]|nr:EAL domain-containing protein [Acidimicrobiia bacterium]